MKNKIVIACDPGNESCGIAVFNVDQKGTFDILWRSTLDPWSLEAPQSIYLAMELLEMGLFTSQTSIHFFYESPVHGTHETREGIARVSGQVLGFFRSIFDILRKNVHSVPVPVWREHYGIANLGREEAKLYAVMHAKNSGYDVESDDEAEAVLMGKFACESMVQGRLDFRRKKKVKKCP